MFQVLLSLVAASSTFQTRRADLLPRDPTYFSPFDPTSRTNAVVGWVHIAEPNMTLERVRQVIEPHLQSWTQYASTIEIHLPTRSPGQEDSHTLATFTVANSSHAYMLRCLDIVFCEATISGPLRMTSSTSALLPISGVMRGVPREWLEEINRCLLPDNVFSRSFKRDLVARTVALSNVHGCMQLFQEYGEPYPPYEEWRREVLLFLQCKDIDYNLNLLRVVPKCMRQAVSRNLPPFGPETAPISEAMDETTPSPDV